MRGKNKGGKNFEEIVTEKPSRSAKKREALALQKLGEQLAALSPEERGELNLPAELAEALRHYDEISDREGKRRQRQYIGRVMRETETGMIEEALEKRRNIRLGHVAAMHKAEKWRNKILEADKNETGSVLDSLLQESVASNNAERRNKIWELVLNIREAHSGERQRLSRQLFREIVAVLNKHAE